MDTSAKAVMDVTVQGLIRFFADNRLLTWQVSRTPRTWRTDGDLHLVSSLCATG